MLKRKHILIAILANLLVNTINGAQAASFTIDDPKGRDSVSFTSDAPIELIVGRTNKITGTVNIDDNLDFSKQPFSASVEVDLASIDTGIPLRNEHMRDNFLETAKYPKAIFKVTAATGKPTILQDGKTIKVNALGEFSLHGKTLKRSIPVQVTYFKNCPTTEGKFKDCDLIQIRSTFPVAFNDYNIKRPEVVFQKLADTVIVTLSVSAHRQAKSSQAAKPGSKSEIKAKTKS
jgi:polyisoprenoid-binding protein YceI